MAALAFKQTFVEPILDGRKTSTIRPHKAGRAEGVLVKFTCRWGQPPFAFARVTRVSQVTREEMESDDALAQAEGFESGAELRKAIDNFYPWPLTEFDRIEFEVLSGT